MATIHISRVEAVHGLDDLISRVTKGDRVLIEENATPVAVLEAPPARQIRLLSESIRILEERGAYALLDSDFERDVNEFVDSHREPLTNFWD